MSVYKWNVQILRKNVYFPVTPSALLVVVLLLLLLVVLLPVWVEVLSSAVPELLLLLSLLVVLRSCGRVASLVNRCRQLEETIGE